MELSRLRPILIGAFVGLAMSFVVAQQNPGPSTSQPVLITGGRPAVTGAVSLNSLVCPGTGCSTLVVSGNASLAIEVTGTWMGTLTFQGSVDGVNFTALNCTPINGTTAVTTTTGNGTWTCSVSGLASVQTVFTIFMSGTAVVSMQTAFAGGGTGGGGGGAASSVTINDPTMTTQKAAVNGAGQLSITCANCSGSGASAVDNSAFTAGTTSGAPAMGFFHSVIDTVTDNSTAALAMDSKRNLFNVIRDAAGNARGVNVSAGNALLIDGSATTQPVSGTFWQATQPVSGTFWQATQPVSGTFWQATQPVSLAGTSAVNVSQMNGVATTMGNGVSGTGVQRVTLASDSTGQVTLAAGANTIGALTANQSVNLAQFGGVAAAFGQAVMASSIPVVLPSDQFVADTTVTLQSAATGTGNGSTLNVASLSNAELTVNCATCSGGTTVTFEASEDNANYGAGLFCQQEGTNTIAIATQAVGVTQWTCPVAGYQVLRARISAYSAGTVTVTGHATASNHDARVVNSNVIGTVTVGGTVGATESGTWTIQPGNTANTTPWLTTIQQAGNAAAVNASGQLSITCANCSGSGASAVDNSAFTAGTTSGAPIMGFYHSTIDTVTDNHTAAVAMDSKRNLFDVIRDAAGNARGVNVSAGNALLVDASATTQPVSGTLTVQNPTTGNLIANVIGTFWQGNDTTATLQNGATANGPGVWLMTTSLATADVTVNCAGCVGTQINFEGTEDGANFTALQCNHEGTDAIVTNDAASGVGLYSCPVGGLQALRARISNYSAGTVTVTGHALAASRQHLVTDANVITLPGIQGLVPSGFSAFSDPLLIGGVFNTVPPTVTTGQAVQLQGTARGALQVSLFNGGVPMLDQQVAAYSLPVVLTTAQIVTLTPPAALTNYALETGGNLAAIKLDTDKIPVLGQALANGSVPVILTTAQLTTLTPLSTVTVTQATGTNLHAVLDGTSGVNVAQMNGTVVSMNTGTPDSGTQRVVEAGGGIECAFITTANTNSTSCKAAGVNFFGYDLYNTTTTVYYLRLYNKPTAPTCSSGDSFVRSVPIPPASASGQVGGAIRMGSIGVLYTAGIGFCITGGPSATDNTNAAIGLFGSVLYR